MADHSDIRFKAGQAAGHAQVKKDEIVDKASNAAQSYKESGQETKEQAGGFIQQTGEQVRNLAQGAAETVKNAVGVGSNNNNNPTTTTTSTTTTKR